ncbi:MAG: DUF2281 domain-containing protein [Candidatus Electrothrix sp. AUS4]|nr:DUF2281 domain-containing protein [Candidatus Electrothrix sp. AUS4]
MQTSRNSIQIGHHFINFSSLPEAAQQELLTFYEFLLFKYQGRKKASAQEKKAILKEIFQEAKGKLPAGYSFDREEIHER